MADCLTRVLPFLPKKGKPALVSSTAPMPSGGLRISVKVDRSPDQTDEDEPPERA
jgi:hypothetical protein